MNLFSFIFLRRRMRILKAVIILAALWFLVALLTNNKGTRHSMVAPAKEAPKIEYKDLEAKLLKKGLELLGSSGSFSDNSPGELGKPVILPKNITEDIKAVVAEGWKKNMFNQYVSDLVSVRRKLLDPRNEWCRLPGRYLEDLPQTSIIICFHNEAWSTLLRTVHSVLDRSSEHLIKEIILVDDFSDMPHLMQQLDDYMSSLPKVRIIRTTRREGLIRARLLGLRHVTAPVLTYLDSHCECTEGWLVPLLDRIARDSTTVVSPVIDIVHENTLQYLYRDKSSVTCGGFDWNLQFKWLDVPAREIARREHAAEPVWTPAISGGLFAIDKEFFERLGSYDSGFDIWGSENLELSLKVWMCGGTLEIVPCSHVGHIFRKRSPYKWLNGVNVLKRNSVRLAQVWLDDYAKYYYQRVGNDKGNYGDISSRVALRKKLECKSFEWYLKNVYPELQIPGESIAHGEIRSVAFQSSCLDSPMTKSDHEKAVGLYPCHQQGGNQFWVYTKTGEIRRDDSCLDYAGNDVTLNFCHGFKGNQLWLYDPHTTLLKHFGNDKCMGVNRDKDSITMEECNEEQPRQMWIMDNFRSDRLDLEYLLN